MSKRAFRKIKAALDSAKAYLDGTADKREIPGSCARGHRRSENPDPVRRR